MAIKSKSELVKKLEKHRDAIGRERDKLREIVSDYTDLLVSCKSASEALDDAIQILSGHA